jgi:geranylgeranyl diphosphate synthase type I
MISEHERLFRRRGFERAPLFPLVGAYSAALFYRPAAVCYVTGLTGLRRRRNVLMTEFFERQKEELSSYIWQVCAREAGEVSMVGSMGPELMDRLADFSCRGKMIRGSLAALGSALVSGKVLPAALPLGAAMELFQSSLLVHDDIMDRDTTRRGIPTIHYRYETEADAGGAGDPGHLGESLGICAGDVAIFLGFSLVAEAGALSGRTNELVRLCSREMNIVGTAQMLDVAWSGSWGSPSADDVIRLYRYKTGRYTFSLPLSAGALIGGGSPVVRGILEELGELIGIIFQIRDDELGLFGDASELGKPVGSDIAEGKRTLYYLTLKARATENERVRINELFGRGNGSGGVEASVVAEVRELAERLEVRESVETLVSGFAETCGLLLERLKAENADAQPWYGYLSELLDYVKTRKN